ncbi:radical SAM protein [Lutimonas sp.]|uniref:radical SAM protein n=1 Tax=Lutimonas sp. TaxID=1872403 RepID=UPI003D9B828F
MSNKEELLLSRGWIEANRPERNLIQMNRPYGWLVEKERAASGKNVDTGIIFISNKECSFRCLMCDLWKNTTEESVPVGAVPEQIKWALGKMPHIKQLKLYNSGSFFDTKAIPVEDYGAIAAMAAGFETVVVEAHPKLINASCLSFRDMLDPELEVAVGLETVHTEVLKKLNKQMTVDDFVRSIKFLNQHNIRSRAFILLRPPFMTEEEGVYWAKKSLDLAFDVGVECCTLIPVRPGNGAMDILMKQGQFEKPSLKSLEEVVDYGISLNAGRVFADTWDLELFSQCSQCFDQRVDRLIRINQNQSLLPKVSCSC